MKTYSIPLNVLQAVVNHLESQPIRDKVAVNLLNAISQICQAQDKPAPTPDEKKPKKTLTPAK